MAYRRKPIYQFDNKDSVGIDKIPNGSMVVVKDYDGVMKQFTKNDTDGVLVVDDTIATALLGSAVNESALEGVYNEAGTEVAVADQTTVFDDRVAQVDTVVVGTVADDTTYSITIDGSDALSYTSGTDATLADIRDNLVTAIDDYAGVSAVADGDNIKVTADAAGTGFTIADQTEVTSSTTIANYTGSVKYEVGSVEIAVNGVAAKAVATNGKWVTMDAALSDGDVVTMRQIGKFEVMSRAQTESKVKDTAATLAKLAQTVDTETKYTDENDGINYKMYISDGNLVIEEIA